MFKRFSLLFSQIFSYLWASCIVSFYQPTSIKINNKCNNHYYYYEEPPHDVMLYMWALLLLLLHILFLHHSLLSYALIENHVQVKARVILITMILFSDHRWTAARARYRTLSSTVWPDLIDCRKVHKQAAAYDSCCRPSQLELNFNFCFGSQRLSVHLSPAQNDRIFVDCDFKENSHQIFSF